MTLKIFPVAPKPYHGASKFWTDSQELGLNETKSQDFPLIIQTHRIKWIISQKELRIEDTTEKIDYDKLKIEERILFYDEELIYYFW